MRVAGRPRAEQAISTQREARVGERVQELAREVNRDAPDRAANATLLPEDNAKTMQKLRCAPSIVHALKCRGIGCGEYEAVGLA